MTLSGVNPDKVVVITGSSSGLGAGMAEFFAEIGYKKIVLVRTYCTKKSHMTATIHFLYLLYV